MIVPLAAAGDAAVFGGKAAALARGLAAGLPIPDGIGIAADAPLARDAVVRSVELLAAPFAVRSSAIGEDGEHHSFAGIHLTRLGVARDEIEDAVRAVRESVHSAAALAYRARRRIGGVPRAAVLIQPLIAVDVAAVVFTRSPISGRDEIVVEASLGLGESIVAGTIVPDRFVLDRAGGLVDEFTGDKDVALVVRDGIVVEIEVSSPQRSAPCLSRSQLAEIVELIGAIEAVWPGPHDLELGFAAGRLYLFQRRPQTR
ncbi:MAG TPA: PEP/pyruvate-binding domain-containing protein [Kofleriaceae bacterium]|nr:PEP/pyruvate-binding domain-containing protein [Kofleriaceae bacterium]